MFQLSYIHLHQLYWKVRLQTGIRWGQSAAEMIDMRLDPIRKTSWIWAGSCLRPVQQMIISNIKIIEVAMLKIFVVYLIISPFFLLSVSSSFLWYLYYKTGLYCHEKVGTKTYCLNRWTIIHVHDSFSRGWHAWSITETILWHAWWP